ncbi:MAG: hypothetical protein RSD35_01535 [Oscillospiraceae bacterium]
MKKLISLLTALVLVTVMLAACGTKPAETPDPDTKPVAPAPASDNVKTGLYAMTNFDGSADAGAEDGIAKTASTIVAVTVDSEGKIDNIAIDQLQSEIKFDAKGKITTDMATELVSKNDRGADYGMKKASSIGKEWNEQIAAFSAYCKGKTLDEIKGIAYDESGKPSDADLASSVTLTVNYFTYAIEGAVKNAKDMGAMKGDKLGLAISGNIEKSKDASADEPGVAQAYSTFTAVTTGSDGKITSCIIDGLQANVNFDATGKITSDLKAAPKTKNELGKEYGLAKASSIGKEWNEQAAAFAEYVTGKTAEEVKGIAMDDSAKAKDADLLASVTVSIGGFVQLVEKAAK